MSFTETEHLEEGVYFVFNLICFGWNWGEDRVLLGGGVEVTLIETSPSLRSFP